MSLETLSGATLDISQNQSLDARGTLCGGCKLSVESDTGGIVVAFGQSLWHVDCFKCAKCGNRVNADTNLLLLSDGSPVCGSCSYNCSVCKLPILDEAIMTGDESYHAACFTCRSCSRKIEELVFAKTSQGIYCMSCHNERVARSRRHAEAKKKKQAKQKREEELKKDRFTAGPTTPSRSETAETQISPPQSATSPSFDPSAGTPKIHNANSAHQYTAKRISTTEIQQDGPLSNSSTALTNHSSNSVMPAIREPAEVSPRPTSSHIVDTGPATPRTRERGDTLTLPGASNGEIGRRRSFDDRPTSQYVNSTTGSSASLGIPTNKVDRRRSMTSGLRLDADVPSTKEWRQHSAVYPPSSIAPLPVHPQNIIVGSQQLNGVEDSALSQGQRAFPTSEPQPSRPRASSLSPGESPSPSRSITPVPSNVRPNGRTSEDSQSDHAPPPPPKERYGSASPPLDSDLDKPVTPPVAPALPPITFSFSDTSFSDLLSSVTDTKPKKEVASPPIVPINEEPTVVSPTSAEAATPTSSTTKFGSAPSSQNGHLDAALEFAPRTSSLDLRSSPASSFTEPYGGKIRERVDSNASVSSGGHRAGGIRADNVDVVSRKLKEALSDTKARAAPAVELDREFVEAILAALQGSQARSVELKTHLDHMKRASQRVYDGLAVAQDEYDQELAHRRDAEAEISRLRLQISTQSATIDSMIADDRRRENMAMMEKEMMENLQILERDLSKLKAEREMTLAEMEELSATKKAAATPETTQLSRSLTNRFDNIRSKYRSELEPLFEQREMLLRELNELKIAKEKSLEEATRLAAQNESLQDLNVKMQQQHDTLQSMIKPRPPEKKAKAAGPSALSNPPSTSASLHSVTTTSTSATLLEAQEDARYGKGAKSDTEAMPAVALRKFGWFKSGSSKDPNSNPGKDMQRELPPPPVPRIAPRAPSPPIIIEKPKVPVVAHNFQQQGILRAARCDHCGDKMWGTQLRCTNCSIAVHTRCLNLVQLSCREGSILEKEVLEINQPLPPSMFGRDLIEQVRADARGTDRLIPVIVEKCIMAVEALAMDYEGIYRKSGGASQSKLITQLFERGDYDAFDLRDSDHFNDICSVTSVLKTYFRSLPNPLLTFDLHEQFVQAASYRDPIAKSHSLANLVNELPAEHFETLRHLMLHLHRVMLQSDINLMNARNLGVVFGPTLMRSADSTKEFADMAGKALAIEWLIENAPAVFEGDDVWTA